jgi:glycosyltransferase involved in cell wall biosynthesis
MKADVIFLSRFNTFCGVSTYTEQLAEAISNHVVNVHAMASDHTVNVTNTSDRDEIPDIPTVVTWNEDGPLKETTQTLIERKPRIVHIQHEFSIFRQAGALLQLCDNLKKEKDIKVILTAHSVPQRGSELVGRFFHLIKSVDAVVVHSRIAYKVIQSYNYRRNEKFPIVQVIPHGMLLPRKRWNKEKARKALCFGQNKNLFIVLALGFISQYKRHMVMLQLLQEINKRNLVKPKKILLVIAGASQPKGSGGKQLVNSLRLSANRMGIGNHVLVIPEFIPFSDLPLFFGFADMTIHMCDSNYHSSSGSIRTDLSYGMPVLTLRSPITQDLPSDVVMFASSEFDIIEKLIFMVKKDEYRKKMSRKALLMAEKHCWDSTALKHVRLYERIIKGPLGKRRDQVRVALFHASPFFRSDPS